MTFVEIGLGLIAAGAATSAAGGIKANNDQAEMEKKNAEFYREQALFAEKAAKRAEDVFAREADQVIGNTITSFGAAGVDLSGSPMLVLLDAERRKAEEIQAIREEGRMNVSLARQRALSADELSRNLSSFWTNALQAGGTLLTGAGSVLSRTK
jgi:hypothetical protein